MPENATLVRNPTTQWGTHTAATFLVVSALFLPQVVSGLYEGLERDIPEACVILSTPFLALSLVAWFSLYSQRHRVQWVMDMGWFVFAAWVHRDPLLHPQPRRSSWPFSNRPFLSDLVRGLGIRLGCQGLDSHTSWWAVTPLSATPYQERRRGITMR